MIRAKITLVLMGIFFGLAFSVRADPPLQLKIDISSIPHGKATNSPSGTIRIEGKVVPLADLDTALQRTGASFKTHVLVAITDAEVNPKTIAALAAALEKLGLGYVDVQTSGTWVLKRLAAKDAANQPSEATR